jgi:hypothetical protein
MRESALRKIFQLAGFVVQLGKLGYLATQELGAARFELRQLLGRV